MTPPLDQRAVAILRALRLRLDDIITAEQHQSFADRERAGEDLALLVAELDAAERARAN